MYLIYFLILTFANFVLCDIIKFEKCNNGGWVCESFASTRSIKFSCINGNIKAGEYYTNTIKASTEIITLTDCEQLTVYLAAEIANKTVNIHNCNGLAIRTDDIRTQNSNTLIVTRSNVTQIKSNNVKGTFNVIKFDNVNIKDIESEGINVNAKEVILRNSIIKNIETNAVKVTADNIVIANNKIDSLKDISVIGKAVSFLNNVIDYIEEDGIKLVGNTVDMNNNVFNNMSRNSFYKSRCAQNDGTTIFNIKNNTFVYVRNYSLNFNVSSCRIVNYSKNKIDCSCSKNNWIFNKDFKELKSLLLGGENLCYKAPCVLPFNIINYLKDNQLCNLRLSGEVMCLLYDDNVRNISRKDIPDDSATEMTPAFYIINQTNINITNLTDFKDAFNVKNRTTIPMTFESTEDFVDALRNTTKRRNPNVLYVKRSESTSVAPNLTDHKQKALEFYKYLYAQLRDKGKYDRNKV